MTIAQVIELPAVASDARGASWRLVSVDVFRGLLVAGMVLVTNAGDWNHVYWPLKHADWNGSTPTDMIFPSFLFLAGVSMTFSFASRLARGMTRTQLAGHIGWRSLLLILIGLFLNGFPLFDMHNLRIPGVLQRIGLCYFCAGLFYLASSGKPKLATGLRVNVWAMVAAIFVLLVSYWALMTFVPVPGYGAGRLDQAGNLGAYIDRSLMGTNHLWFWGGQMWDPEGLLSTLNPIANMLLGVIAGEWLRIAHGSRRRMLGLAFAGVGLMAVGVLLNPLIPINKKIWTDSFMLFSGGFSLLALALLHWLIDRHGWRKGLSPALIFGANAILAFALANMLNPIFGLIHFRGPDGQPIGLNNAVTGWFAHVLDPWNASLAYAVLFVLLNMAILWPLYRRRIFIRL
jgi:predicted acyltransferase